MCFSVCVWGGGGMPVWVSCVHVSWLGTSLRFCTAHHAPVAGASVVLLTVDQREGKRECARREAVLVRGDGGAPYDLCIPRLLSRLPLIRH